MGESLFFNGTFILLCFAHSVNSNTEIDCYENREQELNIKFLKKANYHRQNKNLTPLILNDTLINDSIQWSKHLAIIDQIERSKADCKYGEFTFLFRGFGPYNDSVTDAIQKWYFEIIHLKGRLSNRTCEENQLFWNRTAEMGCGVCTYKGKEPKQNTVITCRVTPSGKCVGCTNQTDTDQQLTRRQC